MSATVVPPQDLEAEKNLLGAILVLPDFLAAVQAEVGLRPEDFYLDSHRLIFGAMLRLAGDGKPTDELLVSDLLGSDGDLEKVGGKHRVYEIAAKVPAAGNALHYAGLVRDKARWRRRLEAAQEAQKAAAGGDEDAFARALAGLSDDRERNRSFYDEERQRGLVLNLLEGKTKAEFFWPLGKLNDLQSGGMRRGQLIVLSGYTSEGKSHFAGQLLDRNRRHGRVCLYDNEMEPAEQAARRATRATGISYGKIINAGLDDQQRERLRTHLDGDAGWPIVDTAGWTVDEVALDIRRHRWDFVVVDILHNFPFENEREIAAAVARLKAAAKLARCCIVLVAHVNRGGITGGIRRRPVRSDLRWSGEIENLADAVCFVYREQDPETFEATEYGAIYFDKCRGGDTGGEAVHFDRDHLRFLAAEREERVPVEEEVVPQW